MVAHMLFKIAILAIAISSATSAAIDNGDFDIDVAKTVENVQSILEAHPELPRLSDDDILTLLQNITDEDKRKIGIPTNNATEEKIMVVLPFKPTDSDIEDMTDLFTKRPITKYVSSHSYNDVETTTEVVTTTTTKEPEKVTKKPSKKATVQKHTESDSGSKQKVVEPFKEFSSNDQLSVESLEVPYSEVSAYENFKPLPMAYQQETADVPIDVQNILKMYDLLQNSQKAENTQVNEDTTETPVSFEYDDDNPKFEQVDANMFPPEMASILTDLGLTKTNPSNAYLPINYETSDLKRSQQQLATGIDPLSLEDIATVDDSLRNDINKRQQSDNSTKEVSTESSTTVSTTTESLKEVSTSSEGPSIEDLENSFGGSKADDDPSEAELPPPRRNGFYYMVDWNSFLEVGDGDTKVNIRFNPKLGDPQRFIPVSTP
ncbi:uncharacterized protein LOC143916090 isoform X2 [Arctopsyche grandis]